ncbi:MAG: DUF1963 domain-containing protein [Albidovulum sp.]|uniref:DUF1963 domain-containing protein n=1 Tax=Albidovulum sp. TaxID=1872424 RepID=UPI003C9AA0C1
MEQTSVILKRQVPIRFDEVPHSWLGGLPMMPKLRKWPRDAEGAPLHFIAQICCADLPEKLWKGMGPRKGWLLLFVETLKLEDHAENKDVQVLHINRLGSERQPPKDAPTVRHSMSDYIDYGAPNIRPGVPKLWRKWPVDIVVQDECLSKAEPKEHDSRSIQAEDLYDGPIASNGLYGNPFSLDRPLTWRGARYVIEGVLRDLEPAEFKRSFAGVGGLLDAPEFDHQEFKKTCRSRVLQHPEFPGGRLYEYARDRDLYKRVEAEVREERNVGWVNRAYRGFDSEIARFEGIKAEIEQAHKADEKEGLAKTENAVWNIQRFEGYRKSLENLIAQYPEPDPEGALTQEIQQLGTEFLDWGARISAAAQAAMQRIDAEDPETPISAEEWEDMTATFSEGSALHWIEQFSVLQQRTSEIHLKKHLDMAVREDILDLYTRDSTALVALPLDLTEDVEERAKYIEPGLPHRLGGLPNPVQDGSLDQGYQLLFQVATDGAIGWMWGDVGALYVTISETNLRKCRFSNLEAWIEGH